MKRNLNIFVGLLLLSLLTACNSMDNAPTNSYTDANFWTSVDKAQLMLNMAYNQMYSAGKMWNDERLSDNVFQGRGFTDQRTIRNGLADAPNGKTSMGALRRATCFWSILTNWKPASR